MALTAQWSVPASDACAMPASTFAEIFAEIFAEMCAEVCAEVRAEIFAESTLTTPTRLSATAYWIARRPDVISNG